MYIIGLSDKRAHMHSHTYRVRLDKRKGIIRVTASLGEEALYPGNNSRNGNSRGNGHKTQQLESGMKVDARYRGGQRAYPGTILVVHRDGTCDIDYDDGEQELSVKPEFITPSPHRSSISPRRALRSEEDYGPRQPINRSRAGSGAFEEGMRVEAKYKGRNRYYPGKVARVHRDGSCDVDYDDGEKERMVHPSLVKVLETFSQTGEHRGRTGILAEGVKVEARYKGRSRYYPGRITRLHQDGSCDIDYDDGEKERMVDPSLIKMVDSGGSSRTSRGIGEYTGRSPSRDSGERSGLLQEGSKVEARYKGRSRYYPGKVARVHRDGSCDIDYDDGEKERMVERSLIKVIETRSSHSSERELSRRRGEEDDTDNANEDRLQEGARVEARYKGRSGYYPGAVTRVRLDGSCDINYDDGEKEYMVDPSLVKVLRPRSKSPTRGRREEVSSSRGELREGVKVEARYKGRNRYYPGKISRVHRDRTCDIDYDDGEKERAVEPSLIKTIEEDNSRGRATPSDDLREGMKVEARYKGRNRYYPGHVARVHSDGTCDINYDDGEKERMVEPSLIKVLGDFQREVGSRARQDGLREGMKVKARYKGRSRYYPGEIARVHRNGMCDIDYDDGEKETMVDPSQIEVLGGGKVNDGPGVSNDLREGVRVEARYKGRSRFYPGKISRVHRDGSCNIDYDDGEQERMVEPTLIKVLVGGNETTRSDVSGALVEGMRVEARYKGRSRYYPGKILRVHRDGSCDIDYDDGEQERMVEPSLIKALSKDKHLLDSNTSNNLREGTKVEARYKGRSRYYPGTISRVYRDGSCDIDYDDGEKERMVEPALIKVLTGDKDKIGVASGDGLREGMRIEARYKGRSRYYPGKISRIHRDGTCDIDYDDGEKERMVAPSLIKVLDRYTERVGSAARNDLREGMRVEARYRGRSRFYPGNISRVHHDGTCNIDYDDGEKERMVEPSLIKVLLGDAQRTRWDANDELREGTKIEARYKGRSRFYPGKISRVHHDGSCDIDYDDGEDERMVDPSLIRVVASRSKSPSRRNPASDRHPDEGSDIGAGTIEKGMRVEARYKGRSRYYPGEVWRVHRDGSCDIDYDDGEKELTVDSSLVRVLDSRREEPQTPKRSSFLREGQHIEARYKGRSRFYPGKIYQVHRDGFCDINYDDGEKEYMVDPSLIKTISTDPSSSEEVVFADKQLQVGMRVEARYKGRSRYYPGKITRVRLDGSCDVDYDDGEQERMVEPSLVRILDPRPKSRGRSGGSNERRKRSSREDNGAEATKCLEKGMKVEARYKGRSRYYPGTIVRAHRDGSCDINYDDGEQERMVESSLIKTTIESDAATAYHRSPRVDSLLEGDKIEARYGGRSKHYPGRVARVHRDGTMDIEYDDGERETRVRPDLVRAHGDSGSRHRTVSPNHLAI